MMEKAITDDSVPKWIPKTREEFLAIFEKYHELIRDGLDKNGADQIWFSEKTILAHILMDFVDQLNPLNDPEQISNRVLNVYKLCRNNNATLLDYIHFLNKEIPGLDLNLGVVPKNIPGLDQLARDGLIPEENWYYDGELLKNCFILWKLFQNSTTRDDNSRIFADEFENYALKYMFKNNGKELNSVTELLNHIFGGKKTPSRPYGCINFFRKMFECALYFYGRWCAAKDLPIDEYLFMNHLMDEEFPDNTRIRIKGVLLYTEEFRTSRTHYYKNRTGAKNSVYKAYILTETGKLFSTTVNIPVQPKKKGQAACQEDLRNTPLGAMIHMSGRVKNRTGYPVEIYWKNKMYEFMPCELTNTRFISIN